MIRVVVRLVIHSSIDIAFPWKEQERRQTYECRRDQYKDEQQESPWFLIAPSVENPPCDHQIEEEINDPDGMDPVNPSMGASLQHFTHAAQHTCHAQSEDD